METDEFAVFLIGMRINRPWKVHKWLPVARAMGRMIDELHRAGDLGLRHVESWFGRTSIMVQYWDSFEALESYATASAGEHLPAWGAFNRSVGSNGDVGIWHETYLIRPGQFVVKGARIAVLSWPDKDGECEQVLNKMIGVGPERTMGQDVELAFLQVSGIALRALSPGVNDPIRSDPKYQNWTSA